MSWQAVARKDVRDAVRSRTFLLLVGLFLLLFVGIAVAVPSLASAEFSNFVLYTLTVVGFLVPLVSIALGYKSVIGERQSGSIKLVLSLPHARRDLAVGKFVGRAVVFTLPVVLGMAAAAVVVALLYESFPIVEYAVLTVATVVFGLAFLGLTLGLSLSTRSNRRVTAGAFGAYVLFVMLWNDLIQFFVLFLYRFMEPSIMFDLPDWALFVQFAAPTESYNRILTALFDVGFESPYTAAGAPWFVDWWVAPILLAGWIVLPVVLGYRRFAKADL